MNRKQFFDGFDLNHDLGFHKQVDTQAVAEVKPIIIERDRFLSSGVKTPPLQFAREYDLVNGFQ